MDSPQTQAPDAPTPIAQVNSLVQTGEKVAVYSSIVELFHAEESTLIRYAFSLTKRREVAEEQVQEAFLKLHEIWDRVENPKAWAYRAIRNQCFNYIRKYKRENLEDEVVIDISEGTPKDKIEQMEAIGSLRMLIAELSQEEKTLVEMKYLKDHSYSEIADATGLKVGNVGYKLHHILKQMGDALRQIGIDQ